MFQFLMFHPTSLSPPFRPCGTFRSTASGRDENPRIPGWALVEGPGFGLRGPCLPLALEGFFTAVVPSGYVKIAIENGHRNSGFSH